METRVSGGIASLSVLLLVLLSQSVVSRAGFATTVPVSAATATSVAGSLFPVSLAVGTRNVFMTDPEVVYIDDRRVGLQLRFQAYENTPEAGIAISETGRALISGEVGYDGRAKQILLYEAKVDRLDFDAETDLTRQLRSEILAAWQANLTNPIRAELPPHPFILPFKEGIQDVSYEKRSIFIQVYYP